MFGSEVTGGLASANKQSLLAPACAVAALRDIRSAVTPLACASVAPSGGRQKLRTLGEKRPAKTCGCRDTCFVRLLHVASQVAYD
jgi:hypothetical protein